MRVPSAGELNPLCITHFHLTHCVCSPFRGQRRWETISTHSERCDCLNEPRWWCSHHWYIEALLAVKVHSLSPCLARLNCLMLNDCSNDHQIIRASTIVSTHYKAQELSVSTARGAGGDRGSLVVIKESECSSFMAIDHPPCMWPSTSHAPSIMWITTLSGKIW